MKQSNSQAPKQSEYNRVRGQRSGTRRTTGLTVALLLLLAGSLLASASASAAAPNLLLRMPDGKSTPGSGAGELNFLSGVAANPDTGHLYLSEGGNHRISEYTAWGAFVKAWGWDVAPEGAPGDTPTDQLEVCTTLCKAGTFGGDGAGQGGAFDDIEVDANGDIFVLQATLVSGEFEQRVQKFSPDGEFLLMFGGEVNKTTGADVCTKADIEGGDVCGAPVPGTGPSEFTRAFMESTYNKGTNTIFVGDKDRIQEFNLDGTFKSQISFEGDLAAFDGKTVSALGSDQDGNLYFGLEALQAEDIYKLSSSGIPLAPGQPGKSEFKAERPSSVAVDGDGIVYVAENRRYVLGFDSGGNPIEGMEAGDEFASSEIQENVQDLLGLAVNQCPGSEGPNLYVARTNAAFTRWNYVVAYGAPPVGCEDPPLNPPVILDQYAASVSRDDAILKAEINPRFWADTKYHVQYGTGKCTDGGCGQTTSEAVLTENVTNSAVTTPGVILTDLEPGTAYHYRFLAKSTGGGPVIGPEKTFRTFAAASAPPPCPNDALRSGPAAALPDCRAYEMVSPLDKGNGDVGLWESRNNASPLNIEFDQSALSGERFTYSSSTAFGGAQSAQFASQYLARRTPAGWLSEGISPPVTESPHASEPLLEAHFRGFSEDLCMAWFVHVSRETLAEGAVPGHPNLYRRENCGTSPDYEAITTVQPPHLVSGDQIHMQGFSQDGSHLLFRMYAKLHPDAPTLEPGTPSFLLYEGTPEGLRFVCYLPNDDPSPQLCSAGMPYDAGVEYSNVHNAISADGSRIYWTAYALSRKEAKPGTVYLRLNGQETLKVSSLVSPDPAFYWTAADDGSKAIFEFASGTKKDELYEFDLAKALAEEPGATRLIAKGVEGPLGASEDASRIYFASTEDLDGGGPASAGAHNLYLYEADPEGGAGSFSFIMALTGADVAGGVADPHDPFVTAGSTSTINLPPAFRAATVSPDGLHAAFMSASATPSGYDNRDLASGKAASEVYRYDAEAGKLRCISCNPTGARPAAGPTGGNLAARFQGWEQLHRRPRALSDDGSRVFFESHEALVPEDTNGTWDVYQWEEPGKGSCTKADPTYGEESGGCVDLISSGQSPRKSTFLDADPRGDNVFFGTLSSLVGSDYGLNDVYVARVGGGFPEPVRRAECEGEACQSPPAPPNDPTPASAGLRGEGNVREASPRKARRCPKGKRRVTRRGKARCVKKQRKQRRRAKSKTRRAGR